MDFHESPQLSPFIINTFIPRNMEEKTSHGGGNGKGMKSGFGHGRAKASGKARDSQVASSAHVEEAGG